MKYACFCLASTKEVCKNSVSLGEESLNYRPLRSVIAQAVQRALWDLVLGFARLPRQLEIALAGMFVPEGFESA